MVTTHNIRASVSLLIVSILSIWILLPTVAGAAVLSDGSLRLSDPRPGQTSAYTFSAAGFTTGTSLGCIQLELNTSADGLGGTPSGVTTTGSTLDSSALVTAGSWTVDNSTNGTLSITNGTGETPAASGDIVWGGVTNGDTADTTYYGIFTTYSDVGCTTSVDNTVVAFIFTDGSLVELRIEPTLTFTVSGVADSQTVNGATTSIATTATSIDFDNSVTASTNGISAHDLGVDTNAPGGYNVYIRHSGDLTNGTDVIDPHTGTYASPTSFLAAGNEAWGFTTQDIGTFATNLWAGFSTTDEVVMANSTGTGGTADQARVGHQVGIASTTPAGTYQTTVIYTVTSTY